MARKRKDSSIILPWERRGGFFRRPGMTRARPLLFILGVILLFLIVGIRERHHAGVRSTRSSLLILRRALDAYRADHERKCPSELAELQAKQYLTTVPTDAWGRPFVLMCPGRFDPDSYELASAGPDGVPGGLDRVE